MTTEPRLLNTELKPPAPVDPPMDPNSPWAPAPPPPPDVPKGLVVGIDDWDTLNFATSSGNDFGEGTTYIDGPLGAPRYLAEDVQQDRWNQFASRERQTLEPPALPVVPPTPGFEIGGGAGGTSAYLEDLVIVTRRLDRATPCAWQIDKQFEALLGDFGEWARRISRRLQDSITPWTSPPLHAGAMQIVEEVELAGSRAKASAWDGGTAAGVTKRDFDELARSVEDARTLYVEAESSAEESLNWLTFSRDWSRRMTSGTPYGIVINQYSSAVQDLVLLGLDRKTDGANDFIGPVREDIVGDLAFSLENPFPMPWQQSPEPSKDVPAVSGALTDFFRPEGATGPRAGIAVPVPTPADLPVVRNVQDAAAGIRNLYRRDDLEPGSIGIQKNTLSDGETTWVVMVPGTQGGVKEDHQFDWLSNFSLMSNEDGPPTQVVRDAMRQAGIESGEKVTLFGHSQGGLAAIDISNSEEFNVTHVLTMGTPTALRPSNPSTQYLAVETQGDVVPALDGTKNSDRTNQTTVRVDRKQMDNGEGLEDLDAHSIENYCGVLEEVERVDDPSTTKYLTSLQDEIFDDPIPTSQGQYRSEPELLTFRATTKLGSLQGPYQAKGTLVD